MSAPRATTSAAAPAAPLAICWTAFRLGARVQSTVLQCNFLLDRRDCFARLGRCAAAAMCTENGSTALTRNTYQDSGSRSSTRAMHLCVPVFSTTVDHALESPPCWYEDAIGCRPRIAGRWIPFELRLSRSRGRSLDGAAGRSARRRRVLFRPLDGVERLAVRVESASSQYSSLAVPLNFQRRREHFWNPTYYTHQTNRTAHGTQPTHQRNRPCKPTGRRRRRHPPYRPHSPNPQPHYASTSYSASSSSPSFTAAALLRFFSAITFSLLLLFLRLGCSSVSSSSCARSITSLRWLLADGNAAWLPSC